jgi:hypothetical protein
LAFQKLLPAIEKAINTCGTGGSSELPNLKIQISGLIADLTNCNSLLSNAEAKAIPPSCSQFER